MKYIVLSLLFLTLLSCKKTKETDNLCNTNLYTGKLVLQGICLNYVIEVMDANFNQDLIVKTWTNNNIVYNNVFALASICDFPEHIKEGDTFRFRVRTDPIEQTCAVCLAFSPTPNKRLQITVCQ